MRAVIVSAVALVGFISFAAPVQAAPVVPRHDLTVSAPVITMVRQRCGVGMKRSNATQDKQGAWHGPCVPKRGAVSGPNSNIVNQGDTANELNAQEAARKAGGAR
jgi:hypothetical protein